MNHMAFDVSMHRNHGVLTSVSPGTGAFDNTIYFSTGDSRISISPSPTLENLYSIEATVRFYLTPLTNPHRFNLMEGHLSFALVIESDLALSGGIVDSHGVWSGIKAPPNIVSVNTWHEASLRHDGISTCQLTLDGRPVATAYNVRGPVQSVNSFGIAIGHWPDPPPAYTFEGYIGEARLYKYDPVPDLLNLIDPNCIDREAIDNLLTTLAGRGWDTSRLRQFAWEMLSRASELAGLLRGGTETGTQAQISATRDLIAGLQRRDRTAVASSLNKVKSEIQQLAASSDIQTLSAGYQQAFSELPLSQKELDRLVSALCLQYARNTT
jgi:hypothetical protein